jgi:hypothetical protein
VIAAAAWTISLTVHRLGNDSFVSQLGNNLK